MNIFSYLKKVLLYLKRRFLINSTADQIDSYFSFRSSNSVWLSKKDLYITLNILDFISSRSNISDLLVLEIGVWKGAWSESILRNRTNINIIGVDPYPGGVIAQNSKQIAIKNLKFFIDSNRFELIDDYTDLKAKFSLIHIDGKHTEEFVKKDLEFSIEHIKNNGVIIVDDYRHDHFPGVSSAMYQFINRYDFRIFLVTEGKAYLCHIKNHTEFYDYCFSKIVGDNVVEIKKYYSDEITEQSGYFQETTVGGYQILLCVGETY